MNIEVVEEFEAIAVRFSGLLHLWIPLPIRSIQTWVMRPGKKWVIEIVVDGDRIFADYDSKEKWEAIIRGIDEILKNKVRI